MPSATKKAAPKKAARTKAQIAAAMQDKNTATIEDAGKYAPTAWGTASSALIQDITVPSGQLVQAKRVTVEGLIQRGLLDNMDTLTALVSKAFRPDGAPVGKTQKDEFAEGLKILGDKDAMASMMGTVDKIVQYVVRQPPLELPPDDDADRAAGVIYTDTVDIDDKMFIFNWSIGVVRSLEDFRAQSATALAGIQSRQGVEETAE